MTLQEKLDKWFIDTAEHKETGIGIEVELPIVPMNGGTVPAAMAARITGLAESMGYAPTGYTQDGCVWAMHNAEGSKLSFDTTWNTLEFSLSPRHELISLYRDYLDIFLPIQKLCMENGYFLCGRGINPNYRDMDITPLDLEKMRALAAFLNRRAPCGDGEIFHAVCASVQTHLDAEDFPSFLKILRMLRKVYVFEALFFANSTAPDESFSAVHPGLEQLERDTVCYRDGIWKYCGAPNSTMLDVPLGSADDFRAYLRRLKVFVTLEDGKMTGTEPVTPEEFLSGHENEAERLIHFRSYEPVAPTKLGTAEIRSTCTQPLDAMFEPVAFYTGLAAVPSQAEAMADAVFARRFPGLGVSDIRAELMRRSNAALRRELMPVGRELLALSEEGLKKRGFGEEIFIHRLTARLEANGWKTPAEYLTGAPLDEARAQTENIYALL